jgi:hypothetical protein
MEGYYKAGSTCSRCHFTCKTCTSASNPTNNSCASCPTGYNLLGGNCSRKTTTIFKEDWTANALLTGTSGTWTINRTLASNTAVCGGFTWLFGFSSYTISTMMLNWLPVKLSYSSSGFSNGGHYGIHFRGTFLFVDEWKSTMSIIFREGGKDIYSYNYLMEQVKGEYLCGQNYHDHITVIDFWFSHNTPGVSLEITASTTTNSWGLKDVVIEELLCDPSCTTCNGPSANDCTQCSSSTHEVLVSGDCVCDIASGWYLSAGACTQTCPTTASFKDNTTRSCIASCVFPLMFHYNGECYEKCPSAAPYRRWNDSYCIA